MPHPGLQGDLHYLIRCKSTCILADTPFFFLDTSKLYPFKDRHYLLAQRLCCSIELYFYTWLIILYTKVTHSFILQYMAVLQGDPMMCLLESSKGRVDHMMGKFCNLIEKSKCDMGNNKRQRHATLPFLKTGMRHWGTPIKSPTTGCLCHLTVHTSLVNFKNRACHMSLCFNPPPSYVLNTCIAMSN